MTPEEAHTEAVRRINSALQSCAEILDLGDLPLDHLPDELGALPRLRILSLGSRLRVGENASGDGEHWPDWEYQYHRPEKHFTDLRPLTALRELVELDLSETPASDLEPLRELTRLKYLGLQNTSVTDLNSLAPLTGLRFLHLRSSSVSNLEPLQALQDLEMLDLSATPVSDISSLRSMPRLGVLGLSFTPLRDLMPLKGLVGLKSLYLEKTPVSDLTPLQSLVGLRVLDISQTTITDLSALRQVAELEHLDLRATPVVNSEPLRGRKKLRSLTLQATKVMNLDPLRGLTGLRDLNLQSTQVSDLRPLERLVELETLDLFNTEVSELGPLRALAGLEDLTLSSTRISDLTALRGLTRLRRLSISYNKEIVDVSPLASLTGLRRLDMYGCKGVKSFSPLRGLLNNLESLRCGGCGFTDLPEEVCVRTLGGDDIEGVRAYFDDHANEPEADANTLHPSPDLGESAPSTRPPTHGTAEPHSIQPLVPQVGPDEKVGACTRSQVVETAPSDKVYAENALEVTAGHDGISMPVSKITLALSGGGLRAALFQLGILLYLSETNRLKNITGIVSVSGGSILAAHFAKYWRDAVRDTAGFAEIAASLVKFARGNLRDTVLIPWLWSRLLPPVWWVRKWGRTARLERAYRKHFGETTIAELAKSGCPDIAFVATDANRQQRVAFTFDRVKRFFIADSSEMPSDIMTKGAKLSLAVAASSCFPPIFPRMRLDHYDLCIRYDEFREVLFVNDGGVTDNLGVEVLLGIRSFGRFDSDMILVCDAERPQVFRPGGGVPDDIEIQSVALSQAAKRHIQSALKGKCKFISFAERTPEDLGLAHETETHLAGFRTDLDSPTWQEIHALILHGAAVADKIISGSAAEDGTKQQIIHTISLIIRGAGGPANLPKPTASDVTQSYRRPVHRILPHLLLVLSLLAVEVYFLSVAMWLLYSRLFHDSPS